MVDTKSNNANVFNRNTILIVLSGIFLGIAIFTKIPVFIMIPLILYIINKKEKPQR